MKSSTVGRSALSKESMDMIENLSNQENDMIYENSSGNSYEVYENLPDEYVRNSDSGSTSSSKSMSKEIDLLWQNFKNQQLNSKSPLVYFIGGIIVGVIITASVFMLLGNSSLSTNVKTVDSSVVAPVEDEITEDSKYSSSQIQDNSINEEEVNIQSEPSDKSVESKVSYSGKTKKYIIKDGDTVERIIKKEYGSYSVERAEAIMKANNLSNLDHISIDQVLLLPIEE